MNIIVIVILFLIAFNFLLKQTFWNRTAVSIITVLSALFVGFIVPVAIEQSRNQIESWLANPSLMLDTSVILMIEIALQFAFCFLTVEINTEPLTIKKSKRITQTILYWFPGFLFLTVLFSALVFILYAFPGISFEVIAWSFAATLLILIPLGRWLIKFLLPEKELRLELFFLTNIILAILGIIATVNGRTAVEGVATINWLALLACISLLLILGAIGYFCSLKKHKKKSQN